MENIQIHQLQSGEEYPMPLLLLADPSMEIINTYIRIGHCFVAKSNGTVTGEYVLWALSFQSTELVNVAVAPNMQGYRIGKQLVCHAVETARMQGYKTIEVGTGNSSIKQLALYQKCGFRMVLIDKDYFRIRYPAPIYENGIECRDMIRLSQSL